MKNSEEIKPFKEKYYYRKRIIELVEGIENQEYLFKIYHYILAKYRREQKEKEAES